MFVKDYSDTQFFIIADLNLAIIHRYLLIVQSPIAALLLQSQSMFSDSATSN